MINVNTIVKEINKSIKGFLTDSTYSASLISGIAYTYLKDKTDTLPGISNDKGDIKYVGIDDKYSLNVYHKIINTTPTKSITARQYGDGNKSTKVVTQMSVIVFANRTKLGIQQEVLANYILAAMPTNINRAILLEESLSDCTIDVLKINFDSSGLYKREYLTESKLKPHQMLFEISYQITYTFNSDCVKTCKC